MRDQAALKSRAAKIVSYLAPSSTEYRLSRYHWYHVLRGPELRSPLQRAMDPGAESVGDLRSPYAVSAVMSCRRSCGVADQLPMHIFPSQKTGIRPVPSREIIRKGETLATGLHKTSLRLAIALSLPVAVLLRKAQDAPQAEHSAGRQVFMDRASSIKLRTGDRTVLKCVTAA